MYLIDIDNQEREHESIKIFIKILPILYASFDNNILGNPLQSLHLEGYSFLRNYDNIKQNSISNLSSENNAYKAYEMFKKITPDLNSLWWYLIEIRENKLNNLISGEIDIIAGNLKFKSDEFRISEESTDYLVGFEVKCSYFSSEKDDIKSFKDYSKKKNKKNEIYLKINELIKTGFNKVVLLDIIANPKSLGNGIVGWFNAGELAHNSFEKIEKALINRVPADSIVGHLVYSEGPVEGGNTTLRNAPYINLIKSACENNHSNSAKRKEINEAIFGILKEREEKLLQDKSLRIQFPFVLIDCRSCGKIHGLDECP